jgi:plasmid stabilization system protein ParE
MAFAIRITPRAERDQYLAATGSDAAIRCYKGLKKAILTLEECPSIPGDPRFRHLLYGRKPHVYRIIFRVDIPKSEVEIMHIRHGKRDPVQVTT